MTLNGEQVNKNMPLLGENVLTPASPAILNLESILFQYVAKVLFA